MSATERRTVVAGDRTVCGDCVIAERMFPRMKGLLGRRSLAEDEGVLLRPASSIHTAFMRFPIDVAFLDRDNRVVRVASNVEPWRVAAARGGKQVLELKAGRAQAVGLKAGDVVVFAESAAQAGEAA